MAKNCPWIIPEITLCRLAMAGVWGFQIEHSGWLDHWRVIWSKFFKYLAKIRFMRLWWLYCSTLYVIHPCSFHVTGVSLIWPSAGVTFVTSRAQARWCTPNTWVAKSIWRRWDRVEMELKTRINLCRRRSWRKRVKCLPRLDGTRPLLFMKIALLQILGATMLTILGKWSFLHRKQMKRHSKTGMQSP